MGLSTQVGEKIYFTRLTLNEKKKRWETQTGRI